jgi:restriction endonuclease S subunit
MDSLIGIVPDDWTEHRLDRVCDILSGGHVEAVDRGHADVPVVTPKDLSNNRIADDCATGASHEAARKLSRYRLEPGDIVCTRRGDLGRQGLVGAHQDGWLVGSACLRLRVRELVGAPYLVHYLGHPAVRQWIAGNTGGAVIPSLSTSMLGALPVVVPPEAVQTSIADTLGSLDDKIVVHEQISRATAALRDVLLPQLLSGANPAGADDSLRSG